ncbi:glucosamine-6-phosphate deaminase [Rhodobacteraceae bacterium RKSG542]|uniref:glucosamine-6-phosphate deaminase n=1 Tax=Pseudovibrio flavus TaxID=2529854 RepID=UPI0012BD7BFC|nr:glucosamine-6-phosphate deaminase [Pseudovibrio flavus]MTI18083.1 glucosamine-6-phosphate deaminase [Pseudovibrio flavus]
MKTLIFKSAQQAEQKASSLIMEMVRAKPDCILGLATGGTMERVYENIVAEYQKGGVSFASVQSFNLDEYVGLAPSHPSSYHTYMKEALFKHIDIQTQNTHLPKGDAADPVAAADAYEALIETSGGIDLQLLGIGKNGHIGFNEPTSSLRSRTRVKTLTTSTLQANRQYFDSDEEMPHFAITMGIESILSARHCVLLATGESKADAAAHMIEGPLSAICPASALQFHQRVTVILDEAAASKLKLKHYYEQVHPAGEDRLYA